MRTFFLFLCLLMMTAANTQNPPVDPEVPVMVLGTFHFAYPNLDVVKTDKKDQIDVLSPQRQAEIEALVERLKAFAPTRIAIETMTAQQARIDSQYQAYLNGSFALPKGEEYQIGFRLAKALGHTKVYCTDVYGNIDYFVQADGKGGYAPRAERQRQLEGYGMLQDSLARVPAAVQQNKTRTEASRYQTIAQILASMNEPAAQLRDHSGYLGQRFRYEADPYDYTGADWVALTWYSRNLRIFRNLQRIPSSGKDRILAIYGAGHAYLLNQFLNESPDYKAVSPLPYLQP